jgi:hypothetical protein
MWMASRRIAVLFALGCLAASLFGVSGAQAASLQSVGTFTEPMYVTSPPAEPDRLFVAERSGWIKQIENGNASTLVDLRSVVDCCVEDRGLQSLAVAPDFASSGRVYLDYTDAAGNIVIAEIRVSGRTAPPSSLRTVLTVPYEPDANHYGGQVQFGPEGDLFISTGDGGNGGKNDEHHNAQSLGTLLGKILRIDPAAAGALPYTVPAGNPFAGAPAPFNTIWSNGLRNPYRFSFDPPSGSIVIPDVGELQREEVDMLPVGASAGANFGWNCREGGLPGPATDPECATPPAGGYVSPIFEYGHKDPGGGGAYGCAIIGGFVVRDPSVADLDGRFVYADFCTAEVRSFAPANPAGTDRSTGLSVGEATSFGEDSCGRVYVMSKAGTVLRLVGASPAKCARLVKSQVSIRAKSRKVKRGGRALLIARVTPCRERQAQRVTFYRGRVKVGRPRLNRNCIARLRPRILRAAGFRAKVAVDAKYRAAVSRPLKISVSFSAGG